MLVYVRSCRMPVYRPARASIFPALIYWHMLSYSLVYMVYHTLLYATDIYRLMIVTSVDL